MNSNPLFVRLTVVGALLAAGACGRADEPAIAPAAPAPLAPEAKTDWPAFLGAAGDGVSAETGLLKKWPEGGPKVLWKVATGDSYAAPVIARGRLVHFHREADKEIVDCLDPATGARFWRFAYGTDYRDQYGAGDGPRSTPVIRGDFVYTLGPGGALHCLDLAAGKLQWRRDLKTDFEIPDSFFGVGTSPVIDGDILLLNIGAADAGIVGLDRTTGKTVWKATKDGAGYSTPVLADVNGTRLAFFFTRAGAVGLEPATGKVRFSVPFRARMNASVNAATPVIIGDQVFFSASYNTGGLLLKVKAGAADEVWRSEAMSCHFATAIHRAGYLYGFDGRYDSGGSRLVCIDLKTGQEVWAKGSVAKGTMIFADGRFIIRSEDKVILAEMTPQGYAEISSASLLKSPAWTVPALSNGLLYVRDQTTLMCLDAKGK